MGKKINILVTGASGFLGKNICTFLKYKDNITIYEVGSDTPEQELFEYLTKSDFIFHLGGVIRPADSNNFLVQNVMFTQKMIDYLTKHKRKPIIVYSSSTQATTDSEFGLSKKKTENILEEFANSQNTIVYNYRLPNVFGKWSRPNYNSVVATFCHNIAHGLPISISNDNHQVNLLYIDDITEEFYQLLDSKRDDNKCFIQCKIDREHSITLGELANSINSFKILREEHTIPDFSNPFTKALYATFLSYLPKHDFARDLQLHADQRGDLFEVIKSKNVGQIFISTTVPGIVRGNHFHHTKVEKFCVIRGDAIIEFRKLDSEEILSYNVSGDKPQVVDIPPGYTHNIKNISDKEMITLFWANEIFDPNVPDTYALNVDNNEKN